MTPHSGDIPSAARPNSAPNQHLASLPPEQDSRQTQTRIRIRIPKSYHQEPVISRLISQHGLTVNITAALLGANARDDGWFDLELRGQSNQINSALTYLNELDLEIWQGADDQSDGW